MEPSSAPTVTRPDFSEQRAALGGGGLFSVLLEGGDTGGRFAVLDFRAVAGFDSMLHMHANEEEVYSILEGEGIVNVGDHEYAVGPGDCVFFHREAPHRLRVTSSFFHCHISLYPAGLEEYFHILTMPHGGQEIPPLNKDFPTPEDLRQMEEMNRKFGLRFL